MTTPTAHTLAALIVDEDFVLAEESIAPRPKPYFRPGAGITFNPSLTRR